MNSKNTHTPAELKKMSSEVLNRLYEKLTGEPMFNPYTDRDQMIATIWAIENDVTSQESMAAFVESLHQGFQNQTATARKQSSQKFSKSQINAMKEFGKSGEWSFYAIAKYFDTTPARIKKILSGQSYRDGGRDVMVKYQNA